MLSASETDLEREIPSARKQERWVKRPFGKTMISREPGEERLLMGTQRSPFSSAMKKAAPLPRFDRQANMLFSWDTRSVRSQENPPSASAARPKWP